MRPLLKPFVFMILLHLASGAEITSIQTPDDTLNVKGGEQLLIPCKFILDEPVEEETIEILWEIAPLESEEFRPLIHLNGTEFLPVEHQNARAWIDLAKVENGNCSLVIKPVQLGDIGTYKIHIAIDEDEYEDSPEIKVQVSPSDLPTGQQTADKLLIVNNEDGQPQFYSIQPGVLRMAKVLQSIKNNGALLFLAILLGIIILLHLVAAGPATYFAAQYFQLRRKMKDEGGQEHSILNESEDDSVVQNNEGGPNEV